MKRFTVLFLALFFLTALQFPAYAENYQMSVTRKGSNVYKVAGKNIIIQTRYCYVYASSEASILESNGYGGDLIFVESNEKCDVKAVYGATNPTQGKYAVTINRESDNWYEIFGANSFIKTSVCLSLALGEEAVLQLSGSGYGQLIFKDGNSCMVEGLYSKMRL
jgi:hypothetical protein